MPTTCKIICEGDKDAVYTYEIAYNPYSKWVDYNVTNTYVVFGLKNYQNGTLLCSTEYHHDIVLDGINNGTTEKVNKGTINVLDGLSYKGNPNDQGVDHPTNDTPLNVNWTVTQKPKQ